MLKNDKGNIGIKILIGILVVLIVVAAILLAMKIANDRSKAVRSN